MSESDTKRLRLTGNGDNECENREINHLTGFTEAIRNLLLPLLADDMASVYALSATCRDAYRAINSEASCVHYDLTVLQLCRKKYGRVHDRILNKTARTGALHAFVYHFSQSDECVKRELTRLIYSACKSGNCDIVKRILQSRSCIDGTQWYSNEHVNMVYHTITRTLGVCCAIGTPEIFDILVNLEHWNRDGAIANIANRANVLDARIRDWICSTGYRIACTYGNATMFIHLSPGYVSVATRTDLVICAASSDSVTLYEGIRASLKADKDSWASFTVVWEHFLCALRNGHMAMIKHLIDKTKYSHAYQATFRKFLNADTGHQRTANILESISAKERRCVALRQARARKWAARHVSLGFPSLETYDDDDDEENY